MTKKRKKPLHKDFDFSKASKALKKLLGQIAKVTPLKNPKVTYKGPEILSSSILSTDFNIKDSFKPEMIEYHAERDRNVIDIFITKVFQLGFSVGRERERAEHQVYKDCVDKILKKLH